MRIKTERERENRSTSTIGAAKLISFFLKECCYVNIIIYIIYDVSLNYFFIYLYIP